MLRISDLVKTYPGPRSGRSAKEPVYAIDGVSLTVEEGEMFTLLGPSGCGKTTTLRSIAGLETPDSGLISVRDRTLFDGKKKIRVPANQRQLGMVFQSYAIWPHMSVYENTVFPLKTVSKSRRLPKKRMEGEVERVLTLMELDHLTSRPATNLSGGQQQRLALARALIARPEILLLDEPLSNLDAKLRESLRLELKRLQQETGQTTVYVTHDQAEALALSTRIAVMKAGHVMQLGTPREIYNEPANYFVADFIGTSNFVSGRVTEVSHESVVVETDLGSFVSSAIPARISTGDEVYVSVRPEAVDIEVEDSGMERSSNTFDGVVSTRAFLGDSLDHVVQLGDLGFRVRSNPSISIVPGTAVTVRVRPADVRIVSKGSNDVQPEAEAATSSELPTGAPDAADRETLPIT